MMLNLPLNNPPMYCSCLALVSPCWYHTECGFNGFGPCGLAMELNPFPFDTKIFFPTTFTFVGYHPTGINPFDLLCPGLDTSNTARQLLSALAIKSVLSSSLNARPFVVDPLGAFGSRAAFNVSTNSSFFKLITETLLSLAFATYNHVPFLV